MYLEPWHADIFDFLELRKNHGKEEMRARDLFPALWIPDLFMKRVYENGEHPPMYTCPSLSLSAFSCFVGFVGLRASELGFLYASPELLGLWIVGAAASWTLMCPAECPGLTDCWGSAFEELYERYEREGRGRRSVPAQQLWFSILQAQIETGTPYMLYKDACNRKSNQQNLGIIRSSNLCCEVVQYTSPEEVAVCNLASVALSRFVNVEEQKFEFDRLKQIVKVVTRNLNRVIDRNFYPVPEARRSNLRHRPIGIGVQGLADAFLLLRMPFESQAARTLNKQIFECIYFAACEASAELAAEEGQAL